MSQLLTPPDLEAFLCGYLRAVLGCEVANRQPSGWDGTTNLVVVRDDGGAKTGPTTFDHSVGVTVYAGTRQDTKPAMDVARRAYAALTSPTVAWEKGSPIAAVADDGCNGPYRVEDDHDASACYLTVEYSVVGEVTDTENEGA
jgi:hypothetical protein